MQGAAFAFAVGGLLLAQPSAASIMLAGSTAIRGSFDGFVTGPPNRGHCNPCSPPATLTGWAVDPSLPGGGVPAVTVAFTIDSAPVSPPLTVVANQPRPDLVKAGLAPNPNHGFVLVLPATVASLLASGEHTVVATVNGSPLPSPCRRFQCGGPAPAPPPPRPPAPEQFQYIENDQVKLGCDLTRGGSIGFFASKQAANPARRNANVVNKHDMGREIQLSYYMGPNPYNPPTPAYPDGACDHLFGPAWPWNPIGAGDVDGNHGQVLKFEKNETSYHLLVRPLQWACHNVSCDCTFEQWVMIDGATATMRSTLHNTRADPKDYGPMDQELPAVYTNGPFSRLITYNGSAPWTNSPVSEYRVGFRGPGAPGGAWIPGLFTPTEHWAAFVDSDGFGMGVVNFHVDTFLGGFSGKPGSGGPDDPATGYLAPVKAIGLPTEGDYTFEVSIVLGEVDEIRKVAASKRPAT